MQHGKPKKIKFLYQWDLYSDLSYQRYKIADQIKEALLEAADSNFEFNGWQRQVRCKYSLTPLSPKGSLIEPGGRFNIPDVNLDQISPFPALFIGEDKETVLQEAGQRKNKEADGLSALDLALVKRDSISIVAVKGRLESVIDLYHPKKLKNFLSLIRQFKISKDVISSAKEIGLPPPKIARSLGSLIDSLLEPEWRAYCMQFDIPANCQIFGQLVANSRIEGILYPSKFTNKKCLAIYPQNFDTDSFIMVEGETPEGTFARLDSSVWPVLKATL